MPAGIMIPARHMSSLVGRNSGMSFGNSSALTLGQMQANLLETQQLPLQHQLIEMQTPPPPTAESDIMRAREDDFESKSGSENIEGASGDEQDANQRPRKKRYHRHTQHQIQEMEAFFKDCPHPDDKQRKDLSRELGLEPLQVKFWFQNKRTQMKTQHERQENGQLRAENERLRTENLRYKEALSNASCPTCGGPATLGEMSFDEHHLRIENARLREEIDRISGIAAKYVGKPMGSYPLLSPSITSRSPLDLGVGGFGTVQATGLAGSDLFRSGEFLRSVSGQPEIDKPLVIELAVAAMEELIRMAQIGEPLWSPSPDGATITLNEEEYIQNFPRGIGPNPFGLKSEASRETAVVIMNHVNLVEILMDANQWSTMFSGIVSRAMTLDVLSTGVAGNYNGALQVMTSEFQVPSPLVPTRESYFVRYCKQHPDGSWAIVDVSLDSIRPSQVMRCRRRPSGCLIQEMPNGYSKVTWVEHVEFDDRSVHNLYKPLVNSGLAFGAKRWVSTLDRQCERLASVMASNIPSGDVGVITTGEGRKSMLKLAERMVISFCGGVSASTTHQWTTLSGSGAEDVRVMTRKSVDDPGRPPGIVLNAATSFWHLKSSSMERKWRFIFLSFAFMMIIFKVRADPKQKVGFRVDLTRVDSNGNFSKIELLQRAARRSHRRMERLIVGNSVAPSHTTDQYSAPIHAGNGEFLMDLSIGTPAAAFSAIVDTGSDLIWTQCQPCIDCFEQPTPIFNPKKSSSFSTLPCSNPLCSALPTSSCSPSSGLCNYLYTYGDSSSTQGVLSSETFRIGSPDPTAAPAIAFGCGDDNQGAGFSQGAGLIGLGRGPLSLISQLNLNRFSYCLTSMDDSKASPLLFGELAELKASTTSSKLLKNAEQPSFYYLSLKGISVGGKRLAIPNGTFDLQSDGSGGVIIDSGTSITYLEEGGYKEVKKAFLKGMNLSAADGSEVGLDVCFEAPAGQDEVEVPKLVLHFDGGGGGGGDLELPAENYIVLDSSTGLLCLTVMGSRGMSIFGNFQQQNLHVLYDLEGEVVSFEPTRCDQL